MKPKPVDTEEVTDHLRGHNEARARWLYLVAIQVDGARVQRTLVPGEKLVQARALAGC